MNLEEKIIGMLSCFVPRGLSKEIKEKDGYVDFLEDVRKSLLEGDSESITKNNFYLNSTFEDQTFINSLFIGEERKLDSIKSINNVLVENKKQTLEVGHKSIELLEGIIVNTKDVLFKVLGVENSSLDKDFKIGSDNFLSKKYFDGIIDFRKNFYKVLQFSGKQIVKKDEEISNQKSEIKILNGERKYFLKKNSQQAENLNYVTNLSYKKDDELNSLGLENEKLKKKIISLEENSFKKQISNKKTLEEKKNLEKKLLESENKKGLFGKFFRKISGKNNKLKKKISELNLTIEQNNASLLSFQNQIKILNGEIESKNSIISNLNKDNENLKEDVKNLKGENFSLSEENSKLEKNLEFEKSENERLGSENDELREENLDFDNENERLKRELEEKNLELNGWNGWYNGIIKESKEIVEKNKREIEEIDNLF